MVNFTIKANEVDGFGSLILPTEEVKLTKASLGRLGLLAITHCYLSLYLYTIITKIFHFII